MEIPGDVFQCWIGAVNQVTFAPVGATAAYRFQKAEVDPRVTEYNTDSNAIPGFSSAIPVKRKAMLKLTQSSFDPLANFSAPTLIAEGIYIRVAFAPYGVAVPALNAAVLARHCYLFPAVLVLAPPIRHDASAGAPVDLEARTVAAYAGIGETAVPFTF